MFCTNLYREKYNSVYGVTDDGYQKAGILENAAKASARSTSGHIVIKKAGSRDYYEYSLEKHKWINKKGITLSETEHDVLTLSAQGYTMNDIADRLCKSVDTIKACKRVLFSKLGVRSITEALSYATNYKML